MWPTRPGVASKTGCGQLRCGQPRCGQQDWVWSARLGVANKTRCGKQHKSNSQSNFYELQISSNNFTKNCDSSYYHSFAITLLFFDAVLIVMNSVSIEVWRQCKIYQSKVIHATIIVDSRKQKHVYSAS